MKNVVYLIENALFAKGFSFLHVGLAQVTVKPLTQKGINASMLKRF